MKTSKKLLCVVLALVMVFAFSSLAMATQTNPGSIDVTNPSTSVSIDGKTFSAYKIFNASIGEASYAYTVAPEFADFTYTVGAKTYTSADIIGYVGTLTNDSEAINAFAAAVWKYIETKDIDATATATAANNAASFTNLELGYYLVYTHGTANGESIIAACALTTTDPTSEVNVKADAPSLEKKVSDNGTTWQDFIDLTIGQTASFKLSSKVPVMTGYTSYVVTFHDTLSAGLDLNDKSFVVKVGATTLTSTQYDLVLDPADDCTFHIAINLYGKTPGDDIVITYDATLNANAVIGDPGNPNHASMSYRNNPNLTDSYAETPDDSVVVYTFPIDVFKYTIITGETKTALVGAEFELYTDSAMKQTMYFTKEEVDGKVVYTVASSTDSSATTVLTGSTADTAEKGKFYVNGLDAGTYYLWESEAPIGFNPLETATIVEIDPIYSIVDGSYVYNAAATDTFTLGDTGTAIQRISVAVENKVGVELPSTGGMGTTIFIIAGVVLMLGAVVLLITRRKMAAKKDN